MVDQRSGLLVFCATGPTAAKDFAHEGGGHRWQRVPPNERRGRVHTSTVTVAVMQAPEEASISIAAAELEWRTTKGSGPGGQNRNKVESAVILTHKPTGLVVRCESERDQHRNRRTALKLLSARLAEAQANAVATAANAARRSQVGSGMRGDKRRTIRTQDGVVADHVTGRRWQLRDYLRGDFDF